MKMGAVILARMSSRRLPGKMLRHLAGKPLIDRVIDRARRIRPGVDVVVATSEDPSDAPLVEHCRSLDVPVWRGSLQNVARRVLDCAESRGWAYFARLNGDSPFLCPVLIAAGMREIHRRGYDLVTNLCPRSYPYGVAVEVFRTDAFRRGYERMERPEDFEHVSAWFYRHLDEFRYLNLRLPVEDLTDVRLTVDDEDDLERLSLEVRQLGEGFDSADLADIIAAYREAGTTQTVGAD